MLQLSPDRCFGHGTSQHVSVVKNPGSAHRALCTLVACPTANAIVMENMTTSGQFSNSRLRCEVLQTDRASLRSCSLDSVGVVGLQRCEALRRTNLVELHWTHACFALLPRGQRDECVRICFRFTSNSNGIPLTTKTLPCHYEQRTVLVFDNNPIPQVRIVGYFGQRPYRQTRCVYVSRACRHCKGWRRLRCRAWSLLRHPRY
jgi:hypothetical protein